MWTLLPSELWDYGLPDLARGLVSAFAPRRHGSRDVIELPGLGPCVPVRSARAGIVLALKALGLRPGARVGVPLYCCPVVFKAICTAGCTPRFIDIDPRTYCLSATDLASKRSEVEAVVAVHMFGNVCEMARLRESAPGKAIIEDCAQALGSRLDGRPAGSLGAVAVFSFHSGKYVSAGDGGALYSSHACLQSRLSESVAALAVPGAVEECVHTAKTFLRSSLRSRPLWGVVGARLWQVYGGIVDYTSQSPVVLAQAYETDRSTAFRRLPLLDSWIGKQRAHAEYYARHLRVDPGMLCSERPGAFYNRLQYPLLVPTSEQCDRLVRCLRKDGISTARPYRHIPEIATTYYGYPGDCPQAERIARSVLVIPCQHALRMRDIAWVASSVNNAWAEIRTSEHACRLPS